MLGDSEGMEIKKEKQRWSRGMRAGSQVAAGVVEKHNAGERERRGQRPAWREEGESNGQEHSDRDVQDMLRCLSFSLRLPDA